MLVINDFLKYLFLKRKSLLLYTFSHHKNKLCSCIYYFINSLNIIIFPILKYFVKKKKNWKILL